MPMGQGIQGLSCAVITIAAPAYLLSWHECFNIVLPVSSWHNLGALKLLMQAAHLTLIAHIRIHLEIHYFAVVRSALFPSSFYWGFYFHLFYLCCVGFLFVARYFCCV